MVKGEVPVFARLATVACAKTPSHSRAPGKRPIWVRVRISFTTGAVRSAFPATAGFLVVITQSNVNRFLPRDAMLVRKCGRPKLSFYVMWPCVSVRFSVSPPQFRVILKRLRQRLWLNRMNTPQRDTKYK